ncbi:MAG: hypothetical protein CMJ85_05180 [Planctomycetes bacterium]|jgi:hypothetical protein|nr:hypothetical protein [Planctomycetota bacterium]
MSATFSIGLLIALLAQGASAAPAQDGAREVTPVVLDDPSQPAKKVWQFTRSQALRRVVHKLPGQTTRRAWHFAKTMLGRVPGEEVVEELIDYLQQQLLSEGETAPARNCIEAMKRSGKTVYAASLMLASRHPKRTVREAALRGLESCADQASIEDLTRQFAEIDLRRQALVIKIVARRGDPRAAASFLRQLVQGEVTPTNLGNLRYRVLVAFEDRPRAAVVRGTLDGLMDLFGSRAAGPKEVVARQLHIAGSEEGRKELVRRLRTAKDPAQQAVLISALGERGPELSRREVEEFAGSDAVPLRLAVAGFLAKIPGRQVVPTLEILASDGDLGVRQAALVGLRGRSSREVNRLVAAVDTAVGTQLRTTLSLLIEIGEPAVVPKVIARLDRAEGRGRRMFLQTLGRLRRPEATEALIAEFCAPPVMIHDRFDSVTYSAVLLANIVESEPQLWAAYGRLGKDMARRSHLLKTLANIAFAGGADAESQARLERIRARLLAIVFDTGAPTRDRVQVLTYVDQTLTLDDAMKLKRLLKVKGQDPAFVRQLNDFLWEFF